MQREIKFRAWDRIASVMWQVNDICFNDGYGNTYANPGLEHMDIQDRDNRTKLNGHEIELMQYTGLKDKNGKEIYEGDILKDEDSPRLERVGWDFSGWWTFDIKTGFNRTNLFVDIEHKEVIGNIWENPELINDD